MVEIDGKEFKNKLESIRTILFDGIRESKNEFSRISYEHQIKTINVIEDYFDMLTAKTISEIEALSNKDKLV